jgi:hypothetical protein
MRVSAANWLINETSYTQAKHYNNNRLTATERLPQRAFDVKIRLNSAIAGEASNTC